MSKKNDNAKRLRQRQKARRQQHQQQAALVSYSGPEADAAMHKQFKRYPYFIVRRGMVAMFPFYKTHIATLEALQRIKVPLDITSMDLVNRLKLNDKSVDELEWMELGHGFEIMFFEDRSDCKQVVDNIRAKGDKRATVATVGDCDEMASAQGYGPELSSFGQFMVNEDAMFARLVNAGGRDIKGFFKNAETGGLTPCVFLGQVEPPEGYLAERAAEQEQQEDDGPEYDTGSGWVDPQ
jgi:hypothetical protein